MGKAEEIPSNPETIHLIFIKCHFANFSEYMFSVSSSLATTTYLDVLDLNFLLL